MIHEKQVTTLTAAAPRIGTALAARFGDNHPKRDADGGNERRWPARFFRASLFSKI